MVSQGVWLVRVSLLALCLWLLCGCGPGESLREPGVSSDGGAQPMGHSQDGARCTRHGAPVALCFLCEPGLRQAGRLWCSEHERYEDRCWWCHPELREAGRDYCESHGLYVDECFLCRPELVRSDGPGPGDGVEALMCGEHGVPEVECGICRPAMLRELGPGASLKVRLPASDSALRAGVRTAPVEEGPVVERIACVGELRFDPLRQFRVVAPVDGIVKEVRVGWGDRVEAGQPLLRIWSAAMEEALARAVLSYQALERERKLRGAGVGAARDLQQAEAEHRAACRHAMSFGFTEAEIHELANRGDAAVSLDLRAPFGGIVLEQKAVVGARVTHGEELCKVVDPSELRGWLYVPESVVDQVRPGLRVELQSEPGSGRTFAGRVAWVSPEVDERTRQVRVMVVVENPEGRLRANGFVRAWIVVSGSGPGVRVPESAVQWVEGRSIVFVERSADLYEARVVALGGRSEGWWRVLEGLDVGEPVVVEGGFALKSQLLISRLGAACVDE